jgi:hypothetical protein
MFARIEQLLLLDTGFPKSRAADLLRRELQNLVPPSEPIPDLGRNSFQHWIERLLENVPANVVLQAASKIRNEYAHMPRTDWPLLKHENDKP